MSRWDDLKRMKDAAKQKVGDTDFSKVAGGAVLGASNLVEGAESVAQRSGLTNKRGEISKMKIARAAIKPGKTARRLFDATTEEVRARREAAGQDPAPE